MNAISHFAAASAGSDVTSSFLMNYENRSKKGIMALQQATLVSRSNIWLGTMQ
jgi:hypothetical protein